MSGTLLALVSAGFILLAVWLSWRAAQTARTPQGAVGWVVFLLTTPYIAVLLYGLFGPHRYKRRTKERRASRLLFDDKRPDRGEVRAPCPSCDRIDRGPFERIAGMPFVPGNRAELLIDGQATFDALFAAIDRAERYLLVQFYTLRDDGLGTEMIDRLIAAADRGVWVMLHTDALGSNGLRRKTLRRMERAGIHGIAQARNRPIARRIQINFRNHRKTVIVDGREAYLGGLNVGDDYMGRNPAFGAWRDSFVRLTGPAVRQLQLVFAEDWHWLTGTALRGDLDWSTPAPTGTTEALIVGTGPSDGEDGAAAVFFAAIAAAETRIWISTPYFVPDMALMAALKHAAARGCEVRILVPDTIDHYLPWLAAFAYFDELREAGVEVWRYTAGFLHQKAMLIDDCLSGIGSANFDNRSFRLNFETMALFLDTAVATEVEEMLRADFARAAPLEKSLDQQPLGIRIGAPLARLFAPVL